MHKLGNAGRGDAAEMTAANAGGYQGITVEDLIAKWLETVDELARREITVTSAKNALEGALSIRYTLLSKLCRSSLTTAFQYTCDHQQTYTVHVSKVLWPQ